MRPPPLTPRHLPWAALGVWTLALLPLVGAVALGQPLLLVGLAVAPLVALRMAGRGPPPRAAVRALEAAGLDVGYDDGLVRTVQVDDRLLRLWTPRTDRADRRFRIAVPHGLPLPDATWVVWSPAGPTSRHAPWDLRTALLEAPFADLAGPAVAVVVTNDAVEMVLPIARAASVAGALQPWVDLTRRLEARFVAQVAQQVRAAGVAHLSFQSGRAGCLCFTGRHDHAEVRVDIGRFVHDTRAWRGRSEARFAHAHGAHHTVIGPCTRDLRSDLVAFLATPPPTGG